MNTPWGYSDSSEKIAEGIAFYGTPSHGGFRVHNSLLDKMPRAFIEGDDYMARQRASGWFEEDCDYNFVILAFPADFTSEQVENAGRVIRNYYPDAYEAAYGCVIPVEDSRNKQERAFREKHKQDYVTVSAIQSDRFSGMVEVFATIGGRDENHRYDSSTGKKFLVPTDEYRTRDYSVGFVIDMSRYQEMPKGE